MATEEFDGQPILIVPALDQKCSKYFTYRRFIECSETQPKLPTENLPTELASYSAIQKLASLVLDPVWDKFGQVELTYGFASRLLIKAILKNEFPRIAPERDQHASHERKLNGKYICPRLGAACDLIIKNRDMRDVAEWVIRNTEVDRVYFYGADRPIHVSYGPNHSRAFVTMLIGKNGRRMPRVVKVL